MGNEWVPAPIRDLAAAVRHAGGTCYVIGGAVRDHLLGHAPGDYDLEVFGLAVDVLERVLVDLGADFGLVDASFGVYQATVDGLAIHLSIPRRERQNGRGHTAFLATLDPQMSAFEAASRRDFTVNALLYDPLADRLRDFFGGVADLADARLDPVGPRFVEDPLRVLRAMRFAAEHGMHVSPRCVGLAHAMMAEHDALPAARLWGEWSRWAAARFPAHGLRALRATGWLGHYIPLDLLRGVPQSPLFHPEGDVWEHTLLVVGAMARLCDAAGLVGEARWVPLFAALLHDTGKATATIVDPDPERQRGGNRGITSIGHEAASAAIAALFLAQIGAPGRVIERVVPLVREHMVHPGGLPSMRRLAQRLAPATVAEWLLLRGADHWGRGVDHAFFRTEESLVALKALADQAAVLDAPVAPLIMGRDLIARGWHPGPHFKPVLDAALEWQLDGIFTDRESALAWLAVYLNGRDEQGLRPTAVTGD